MIEDSGIVLRVMIDQVFEVLNRAIVRTYNRAEMKGVSIFDGDISHACSPGMTDEQVCLRRVERK